LLTCTSLSSPLLPTISFFTPTSTPQTYTLSLHDALPILTTEIFGEGESMGPLTPAMKKEVVESQGDIKYDVDWTTLAEYQQSLVDRKSTRLNSSHVAISYAVFCLKKKNKKSIVKH